MQTFRSVSRVLAAAVSSAFIIAPTPSLAFTVTVNGTGVSSCQTPFVDTQGNITINCSTSTSACSVSAQPTSVPASGGTVSLTSNCGTVTSWSGGKSASGGQSTNWTDSIPANTSSSSQTFRYSVVGSNGSSFVDVTQQGAGTAPPPTGSISCSNIAGISNTKVIPVAWQTTIGTGFSTSKQGGFAPGDAVVFVVTPPVGASTHGGFGTFRVSPSDGNAYNTRIMSISATPCDFSRSMGTASMVQGQEPTLYFTVGGNAVDKYGRTITSNANLTADGRSYYITVIQQLTVGGTNACNSSSCNVNYGLTPGT